MPLRYTAEVAHFFEIIGFVCFHLGSRDFDEEQNSVNRLSCSVFKTKIRFCKADFHRRRECARAPKARGVEGVGMTAFV